MAGIFDYLSLRTNGYEWHMDLTAGKVEWTDPKVKDVFAQFAKLQPYVTANHAAIDWQDAAALLVQGKAANYVMGNFAVGVFKEGGMTNENLGFMVFPEITPVSARRGSPDRHDPHSGRRAERRRREEIPRLRRLARGPDQVERRGRPAAHQQELDRGPGRSVPGGGLRDAVLGLCPAQFFDRDAPAEMAKAGMEGFQQFLVQPDQLDNILARLEQVRQQVYK